jgi:peptide/nickel transport system substrate-binding protein
MRLSRLQLLVTSCLLLAASAGRASSRPHYGGTVRILLQYRVNSIDPLAEEDHPATRDRLARMTFETLTQVDAQGRVRPRLATWWRGDSTRRVWQLHLRVASFHDGTPVTAADAVASLKMAEPGWRYTAGDRQTVTIETPSPVSHLPEMLALQKFAIIKRRTDGILLGSGPYRLSQWQAGERAAFTADEDYWGGRSYPDAIEFQMGAGLREQLLQRQLGPNAAAELYPDGVRALEQSGQEVLLSRPADLLVIVFLQADDPISPGRKKPVDPRLRQALAAAMDRAAISNAMLQKKGAPASGLLPQWLTGYEFLLNSAFDRERAHKLVAEARLGAPPAPISLAYDFADPVAKLVAERIAFDSSQAGLTVRPYGENHLSSKSAQAAMSADAILLRLPLASLEPSVALAVRAGDLGVDPETMSAVLGATRPEDLLQAERKVLENLRIIPAAHVSQALWLNGSAHNWLLLPNGLWDLDQLWVEGGR